MSTSNFQTRPEFFESEEILPFDWRKLTALGVSQEDARTISVSLVVKKKMTLYWRKLVRLGVPADDAIKLARAIAKYDVTQIIPKPRHKQLIRQYCPLICRAGLWRSNLLLVERS